MSYRLSLSFDPDYNYNKLQPKHKADGGVDHFELGYVQCVHRDEVLACWEDSDQNVIEKAKFSLELEERKLPVGPNSYVDPVRPDCLLASVDGYIVYRDNEVSVKTLLNVRRDVDFHTGNIIFPGDMVFASDVRSGFSIQGRHIWVKGDVEAANLRALGSVIVDGGVKGGKTGQIRARGGVRVRFCEQCRLRARTGILVKGSSMHCRLYAGRKLVVSERLIGGRAVSRDMVYVKEQLGGGLSTETEVIVGYDPALLLRDDMVVEKMRKLRDELSSYERIIRREGAVAEIQEKVRETSARIADLKKRRAEMWGSFNAFGNYNKCRIIVPGAVRPGVDIFIGPAYLKIQDFMEDVSFYYKDGEVCVASPALPGKRK